jgi:hypothetical protein
LILYSKLINARVQSESQSWGELQLFGHPE